MEPEKAEPDELLPREKGFICRIMQKYPGGKSTEKTLYRSLIIFCAMILAAHLIERVIPDSPARLSWWLPLLVILPPALFMFSRYRKFSIFRSCVLSKVAGRLAQYENLTPPPAASGHPHAHRAASNTPKRSQSGTPGIEHG